MGVNYVNLANGEDLIDLRNDSVTPETLAKGETAHNKKGELIVGTMVAGEGGTGGGSGIIEVPELPTENIDENAIYKVVVNEEGTLYVIMGGSTYKVADFLISLGVKEFHTYFVDELPSDMLKTDQNAGVAHCYVVNSTGIGYVSMAGMTGSLTVGTVLGQSNKGYTVDITLETENGIYVQRGKHSEDWFYRESGEWVRITPEQEFKQFTLTAPKKTIIEPNEGKVFSSVEVNIGFNAIGDFIDHGTTIEKITENDLAKTDGTNLMYIREYAFAYAKVKSITLPPTVRTIGGNAFDYTEVEEVTFKGKPITLANGLFLTCTNLKTINVSWRNGEMSGAPWGATNATINYNYTGE